MRDQLYIIDETFKAEPANFKYVNLKTGMEIGVETLEKLSNTLMKIFAPYLASAKEITVEDPFIRASWQVKNFMEFCAMLIDTRPVDDLKLNLVTNEDDEKIPELIDKFDEIKNDLASYGIRFEYSFRAFHDRRIHTDTGWTISLGRGLDIFEKYSPLSIANNRQDKRKCKEFMVTYTKNK